ncbi:MAG: hypothetical protein ABIO49_08285, partial [Dokdonella sp.]
MQPVRSAHRRVDTFLGMLIGTSVLIGLVSSVAIAAPPKTTKPAAATAASASSATKPEIARTQTAWHASLLKLQRPVPGCYTSAFPRVEWKAVECGEAPKYPMPPAHGNA